MKVSFPGFLAAAWFAITANAQLSAAPRRLRALQVAPEVVGDLAFGTDFSLSLSMGNDANFVIAGGAMNGDWWSSSGKSGKGSSGWGSSSSGKSGKGWAGDSGAIDVEAMDGDWWSSSGKSGKGSSGWGSSSSGKSGKGWAGETGAIDVKAMDGGWWSSSSSSSGKSGKGSAGWWSSSSGKSGKGSGGGGGAVEGSDEPYYSCGWSDGSTDAPPSDFLETELAEWAGGWWSSSGKSGKGSAGWWSSSSGKSGKGAHDGGSEGAIDGLGDLEAFEASMSMAAIDGEAMDGDWWSSSGKSGKGSAGWWSSSSGKSGKGSAPSGAISGLGGLEAFEASMSMGDIDVSMSMGGVPSPTPPAESTLPPVAESTPAPVPPARQPCNCVIPWLCPEFC